MFKATIVIWSEVDPRKMELSDLAREAEVGNAYCAKMDAVKVKKPADDPDWDDGASEFFYVGGVVPAPECEHPDTCGTCHRCQLPTHPGACK